MKAYDGWMREVKLPPDTSAKASTPAPVAVAVLDKHNAAADSYDIVVEKNLFAAERKEIDAPPPEAEKKKTTSTKRRRGDQLTLLGVVVTEERKTALVQGKKSKEDPRGIRWVVKGDEINGMRVLDILDEKILLSRQDENVEVLLYDPDRPKKRARVRKKQETPTVMSTGDKPDTKKVVKKTTSQKKKRVIRKRTNTEPAKPPRFGPPVLRKKKE
jgi:hypothetical protein